MAASTGRGIVYPTTGDNIDVLESVFAALASSVDTALGNYILSSSFASAAQVQTGSSTTTVVSPKALRDAGVYAGDTGWVNISSSVTAGSGWSKGSGFVARARRVGELVQIAVSGLAKTSSPTLAVGVSGNIANTVVLGGVPSQFRPGQSSALSPLSGGRSACYYIGVSGDILMTSIVPNVNWTGTKNLPTGEGASFGGMYFGA